jgi:hypothetical protein
LLHNIQDHFCNPDNLNGHYEQQSNVPGPRKTNKQIGFCLDCMNLNKKYSNIKQSCRKNHECLSYCGMQIFRSDTNKLFCTLCSNFFKCTEDGYHDFVKHFNSSDEKHSRLLQKSLSEQYGICLNPSCCKLYSDISNHQCENQDFSLREVYTLNIFYQKYHHNL